MADVNFPDNDAIVQITATGGQTVFNTDYPLLDQTHIDVFQNGVLQTLTTHYTVSGLDNQSGATITLITGATNGDILTLARNVPVERLTDYAVQGAFTATSVNLELDNIAQWSQQIERDLTGAIRTFVYDPQHDLNQIPVKDTRKGKLLAFDATTGHPVVSTATLANLEAHLLGTVGLGLDDNATGTVLTLEDTFINSAVAIRVGGVEVISVAGKLLASALPVSAMEFKGVWNANTNTPALTSGVGDDGDFYKISVAGSTNLDGETDWKIGDALVFGNSVWNKLDNTDQVSSVFGRSGAIVAVAGDYTASQITNVAAGSISATDVQAAINELDTEKQAQDATLTSIAALGTVADRGLYTTGADVWAEFIFTAAGRAILDDANAPAQRTTLGLGALAILSTVGTGEIDNNAVTLLKLLDIATNSILGRITAATGNPEVLTAANVRTIINVEDGADVTDATNVGAAGAVMDGDISPAEGFIRKTGAGAYTAHKSNLSASTTPGVTDDSAAGYSISSIWVDLTGDQAFICVDATASAAVWIDMGLGGGETNTMSSAGTAIEIFNAKVGADFPMRDLLGLATGGIDVVQNGNNIELDLDVGNMTNKVTPLSTDEVAIQATAGGALNKATLANLSKGIDHDLLVNFVADEHFLQSAITTVGTITIGVWAGTDIGVAAGGTGASSASAARTNLGLVIGNDVQAFNANNAVTNIAQEYTAQQNFNATTLTDAANIAWNLNTNQVASVTLAGNRTLDNPTNMKDGSTYLLRVIQDATGSRTLAYGTAYKWPGGTAPTLTTAANAVDYLTFISDGTSMFGDSRLDFS